MTISWRSAYLGVHTNGHTYFRVRVVGYTSIRNRNTRDMAIRTFPLGTKTFVLIVKSKSFGHQRLQMKIKQIRFKIGTNSK